MLNLKLKEHKPGAAEEYPMERDYVGVGPTRAEWGDKDIKS